MSMPLYGRNKYTRKNGRAKNTSSGNNFTSMSKFLQAFAHPNNNMKSLDKNK